MHDKSHASYNEYISIEPRLEHALMHPDAAANANNGLTALLHKTVVYPTDDFSVILGILFRM